MKKLFLLFILYFSSTLSSSAKTLINYSIFIEEDSTGIMLINRYSDKSVEGKMISYGGYKWIKEVYTKSTPDNSSTYITPGKYAYGNDVENYTRPEYEIENFYFNFSYRKNDYIVDFISPEAIQNIEGFISRKETFSLATYNPRLAWYAGTFTPIKNVEDLNYISNQNSITLCNILSEKEVVSSINRELNEKLSNNFKCDDNNTLISNNSSSVQNNNTEDEQTKKFYALDWFNLDDPKEHYAEIPSSNSEVYILESEMYIKGQQEIDKFSNILFGHSANENDMVIIDSSDFAYTIYINYKDEGYISLKDWKDVDSKQLLEEMKSTAKDDVTNVSWIFEPKIYENKNVSYSYKVIWQDGAQTLETKILSLGRKGYNSISVVKKIDEDFNTKEFEEFALDFANTITFKEGFRHSDYKSGDKAAAVGIGGLVAGTLGVKALAKAGIIAKLLAFAVKFWWVILAPLVFLGSLFSKKSSSGETSSEKVTKKRKKRTKKTD